MGPTSLDQRTKHHGSKMANNLLEITKIVTKDEFRSCLPVMKHGAIIFSHSDAFITSSGCEKTKQGRSLPKELKALQKFCGIFQLR